MARRIGLATRMWKESPLEELAPKASEWGYQGLDLHLGPTHLDLQTVLSKPDQASSVLNLLEKNDLRLFSLSVHPLGQAVGDVVDERHQHSLSKKVWGDGESAGVSERAGQEILEAARFGLQAGVSLLTGSMGSTVWPYLFPLPETPAKLIDTAWKTLYGKWKPVLDGLRKAGVYYALEPGPGQPAFDLYSAELMLHHFDGHDAILFAVNPGTLHWQGVDPVEFLRAFPERIASVIACDSALSLNGRSGILGSHLAESDPRRGWAYRSIGHGTVDWPAFFRALNQIQFDGPISVLCNDPDMHRDYAANDAIGYIKRMDIEPPGREE